MSIIGGSERSGPGGEFVPDKVALALHCSPATAHRRCQLAMDAARHPALMFGWSAGGREDARTMDQRRADALVDLLVGRAEPPRVSVQVIAPAATLAGSGDEPAEIVGVGPV
jgi:hypothetical protein